MYIVAQQQKSFQLKMLCLKCVKCYIKKKASKYRMNRVQTSPKINYLFIKSFFCKNLSDFILYNEDNSISFT